MMFTVVMNLLKREHCAPFIDNMRDTHLESLEPGFTRPSKRTLADGYEVTMVSWGDPVSEREYVLDRIRAFLRGHGDIDFPEEYEEWGSIDELEHLIEGWEAKARELYGMPVETAPDPVQLELDPKV